MLRSRPTRTTCRYLNPDALDICGPGRYTRSLCLPDPHHGCTSPGSAAFFAPDQSQGSPGHGAAGLELGGRRCGGGPVRDGRGRGPPGRGDPGGSLPPRDPGLRRVRGRPDPGIGCRGSGPGRDLLALQPRHRGTQARPAAGCSPAPVAPLCRPEAGWAYRSHRQSGHHQPHHPQETSGRTPGRFAAAGSGPGNRGLGGVGCGSGPGLFEPQGHYRRPRRRDPGVSPYRWGPRGESRGWSRPQVAGGRREQAAGPPSSLAPEPRRRTQTGPGLDGPVAFIAGRREQAGEPASSGRAGR
jgi:hypothetical protein